MGILDFFGSLPKRGDVSPEELAARREAYRQAYQDSFLARNRDSKPSSVQALEDYGEYLPLYGDATAFMEAGGLLSEGNRKAAALVAAGGLLGVVPGAGDIVARPLIAAGRKAADIANRIEIDPSMVGSMGGNLKVRPKENTIKVYHGGPEQITSPKMMADPEGQPKGFSVTPQKEVAEFYKRLRGGGHVSEFSIDKNKYNPISEYDLYSLIDETEIRLGLDEGELTNDQISQMLSDRGINAISYANPDFGIRILSEDILTPASQGLLQ